MKLDEIFGWKRRGAAAKRLADLQQDQNAHAADIQSRGGKLNQDDVISLLRRQSDAEKAGRMGIYGSIFDMRKSRDLYRVGAAIANSLQALKSDGKTYVDFNGRKDDPDDRRVLLVQYDFEEGIPPKHYDIYEKAFQVLGIKDGMAKWIRGSGVEEKFGDYWIIATADDGYYFEITG